MKTKNKLIILCLSALFLPASLLAQNPFYTEIYAQASNYNPALTGIMQQPFLNMSYRNQWAGVITTAAANYEQEVRTLHGGLGLGVVNNWIGNVRTNSVKLQYAFAQKIGKTFRLRAGVMLSYNSRFLDTAAVRWAAIEQLSRNPVPYYNVGAGLSLSYKWLHGGISASNITRPNISFSNTPYLLTVLWTGQLGSFIHLDRDSVKGWLLNPYLQYQQQYAASQYIFGVNVAKGAFSSGLSVHEINMRGGSANLNLGFYKGRFKLGYSYNANFGFADAGPMTPSSHEFFIGFFFGKKDKYTDDLNAWQYRRLQ